MSSLKVITNSRKGVCASCKADVSPNAGKAFTRGQGWQVVCASSACHTALGLIESIERSLKSASDGSPSLWVRTPKDGNALPLLRALPGARWNAERSLWSCSASVADRARVLEIADQLGLEVEADLRNIMLPANAEAAKERASDPRLYPFQRIGVEYLALHDRALLADDMGLGKTVQALLALPPGKPAIVICPASVKLNWRDECVRWRPDLWPVVLEGRKSFRAPIPSLVSLKDAPEVAISFPTVLIVNFDILPDSLIPDATIKAFDPKASVWGEQFSDCTLIVDEAHAVKNFKAKRSKKVRALAGLCGRVWFLTGTPLLNHPPDLFGVLEAGGMAGTVFGGFRRFQDLFNARAVRHGRGFKDVHTEYGSPKPEAAERLKRVMLRRMKAEVLPDLPSKVYQTIPVNGLSKSLRTELDALQAEYGEEIELTEELPGFEAFSKVRAMLAESRIDAMLEIVEEHEDAGIPLVVFSAHRAPIDALAERSGWATINGDVTATIRQERVQAFQDDNLWGLGLTIQAGGVGLTLTRASRVLFVDLDWTPALNAQAEDRVCRIGQTSTSVQVIRMVSDHPLDKHINRLLTEKQDLIFRAVDQKYRYEHGKAAGCAHHNAGLVEETEAAMVVRKAAIESAARIADAQRKQDRIGAIAERYGVDIDGSVPDESLVQGAYEYLVSRCDGAIARDGMGFNKIHATLVHYIAGTDHSDLRTRALWSIVRIYKWQIAGRFPELFQGTGEGVRA